MSQSRKNIRKAILVFTNFWDADFLIGNKHLLFQHLGHHVYRLDLNNFETKTIALSSPPLNKFKNFTSMERIDCLCPTYDILSDYKRDKNWDIYTERYMGILKARREKLKEWINSLETDKIYLLCCWENTSGKAHCHRKLVYDAIELSKNARSKVFPIYRNGEGAKEIVSDDLVKFKSFDRGNNINAEYVGSQIPF